MVDGQMKAVDDDQSPWDTLRNAFRVFKPDVVVCERGPTFERHLRAVLEEVESIVREEAENIVWVSPGQWKNTPASRGERIEGASVHARDAAGIARWYNYTQGAKRGNSTRTDSA